CSVSGVATISAATEHEMRAVVFERELPAGEVEIELAYGGHVGEDIEGLFRQRAGGKWFLYSQAEATYARRIVPCFDEPRFKVPWRVTVVAPAGQGVLANAPVERERALDDKRREVRFVAMPSLPAHLLAIAVGPFALVDVARVGKQRVPVRAAVMPRDAKRVGSLATWVPRLVDALEVYFDRPLPLAKLDLVAVPRFFGAMENPGLVTFEVTSLVGDPRNAAFLRRHIRFLGHELAHQWVGNLVTPAWWNDLWLAEAFATWLDDKLSSTLGALDDPALRTQRSRAHALAADRDANAMPLRRTITSNEDIEGAFDAISYEKGAAVIAMFEQYVGEATFRRILRDYIQHAGPATANDFVEAFARVDPALADAFASYLDRAGAPIVDLAMACTDVPRVVATPRDGAAVPLCLRHPGGKTCTLARGPTTIELARCPAWVVGNADGRGYYHVQWARPPAAAPLTTAERLAHGEDRAAAIARGELARSTALAEIDTLLALRDPYAELAAVAMLAELNRTIPESELAAWSDALAHRLAKRLTFAAVFGTRTPVELAIRDVVLELVPPARFAKPVQQLARNAVERALRDGPLVVRSA
ncbi:MAG TPA: M1 family metallopeptidase, partial [Kofleriaceae bacterium]|nr:M1 family metallopeptidase [Kofleriaceae bacterium]